MREISYKRNRMRLTKTTRKCNSLSRLYDPRGINQNAVSRPSNYDRMTKFWFSCSSYPARRVLSNFKLRRNDPTSVTLTRFSYFEESPMSFPLSSSLWRYSPIFSVENEILILVEIARRFLICREDDDDDNDEVSFSMVHPPVLGRNNHHYIQEITCL